MTSILLMLLLSVIRAQRVSPLPSCPASCVVCSEDAVICQRLAHIIDAPDSTQALLLTDGSISTVQPASLSDLSNITVIGLSHNHISELNREAFRNLPFLHTLLLDHNLLTSQALQGGALTNLTQLEVLALGHNLISMIQASWFKGTKALRSLKLEGNLLISLDSSSFSLNDLRELESLDLSDNLIDNLDRNSFSGVVSLKTLDLSRNRLSSAPAEAFSYLSWLTNLNLDLNSWNCSCQLLELAAFLSTFIQQPDKTLYNGRRMVCVSADNPAVTTVLELTKANCVPSNQNITVQIETRGGVMPKQYARDLAITAVICFIGGVGLTLLVVLIYYQVSRRKKLKQSQGLKEEEGGSSAVANHHVNHLDVSKRSREVFLHANNSQPWKEGMAFDVRTDGHGGQFRSRGDENGSYYRCPNCSTDGLRLHPMRRDNRMNGGIDVDEDRERRRVRMMMEDERRRTGIQQGVLNRDALNKFLPRANLNSSSHPQRETFSQRTETLPPYKTGRDLDNPRTDVEAKSRGYETLNCESCHRMYRPPEQNTRQGRIHTNPRDSALLDGFPSQHGLNERGRNGHYQFDTMKSTRNVTFDLESPRSLEHGNSQGVLEEEATTRDKEKGRERRQKVQSSRLLKVKLNLNPLRKSKVHPKRKNEHAHTSKEKRRDGKERGEKDGKGKSSKKTKDSSRKTRKSSTKNGEEEKDDKDEREGGQKSKTSSKQKKTASRSEQGDQGKTEGDQGEKSHPENAQPADAVDQTTSAVVTGHGQSLQDVQYQGASVAPGSAQLSSQHPFSLLAADRNRSTNLSLLGSAGAQLTGSSLSLQGGNLLLGTMASGSNALFSSNPANSVAPSVAFSGPNLAPRGAPDSLARQGAVAVTSSAPSLLANTVHTNPLQVSAIHTTPQAAGCPLSSAVNPTVIPAPVQSLSQSQLPSNSSPLVGRLKPNPAQGPSTQIEEGLHQLPTESQAPSTKESLPVQGQDGVTPQNLESVTVVENMSNNNSQTEAGRVPGGSAVSVSAGGLALTEGPAVGGSGDSVQAAGVSVSGVSAASPLLQQEYLSEEAGSSPRRKLKLVLPEKTSSRPPTALERKIR